MPSDAPTRRRKLAAILMADVSGFSAMMGRDEERTTELIQDFHLRVRAMVEKDEGRVVDTAGDSVFGSFDSVVNAVRCAQAIQEGQAQRNSSAPPGERITTRIGVHLGDVIVENQRIYGDGVNIAARLEQLAEPGGICVSEAVYQQIQNKLDLDFRDLGVRELKNIQQPLRLYGLPPLERERPQIEFQARPQPPARAQPRTEQAGPLQAVVRHIPPGSPIRVWYAEILRAGILLPVLAGAALLVSEILLFPSGGILPTAGAMLLGTMLGTVWTRLTGKRGNRMIALGIGIASGALLTGWSAVTNVLFVFAGLGVAASGVSMNVTREAPPRERRGRRRRKRRPRARIADASRRR